MEFDNDEEFDARDVNGLKKKGGGGGFNGFNLSQPLMKGIWKRGFKIPTPIQRKTIPLILEGNDVVGMARTGSGKTAAFLIPLFEKLQGARSQSTTIGPDARIKYPRALILSPTRELATQTLTFFKELGKFLNLKVVSILGGDSMDSQFAALHDNPDVVIATPGRFMHLCVEMELKLDGVQYIVFDEADRLFEMGFGEQLAEILRRLPESRQTVLFSATLPKLLVEFTKAGLRNPVLVRLDVDTKLPDRLALQFYACRTDDKIATLMYLLANEIDRRDQTIVFVATKHHVEYLHTLVDELSISNCYIYSSLDPTARKIALDNFRSGKAAVMIVTDIAARGIDIPVLDNVINFHFPAKPKLFMHRVGRVARAGRSGTAYSIVAPDEIAFLFELHLFLGRPLHFTNLEQAKPSDSIVGRIPQDLIDQEQTALRSLHNTKSDLGGLWKVCNNGYTQYLKSRPNASGDSNKRAKAVEVSKIPIHSSFGKYYKEDPMNTLVAQMQNYRPRATIFEICPKAGSDVLKVMKEKRIKDQKFVEKHRTSKIEVPIGLDGDVASGPVGVATASGKGKHDENFIPYLPSDHHTETGLSVTSSFEKQVQDAVMDITGDDSKVLKAQHSLQKWDRKKKKFVSTGNDKSSKKIKTESGAWISASYKSDRYSQWKQKSKVDNQEPDDDDDGEDEQPRKKGRMNGPPFERKGRMNGSQFQRKGQMNGSSFQRKGQMNLNGSPFDKKGHHQKFRKTNNEVSEFSSKKGKGKFQNQQSPATNSGGKIKGRRFRTELKRPEEILKNRKIKERNQTKNKPKKKKRKQR